MLAGASLLPAQPYVISTAAGGVPPSTPAAAIGSSVSPGGLAIDAAGNVYFSSHNAVFRVDSKGILTHIAGTSRPGFSGDGGPAISAQLNYPNGVAVDPSGNVYIADTGNNRVRKVSPDGIVTSIGIQVYAPFGLAIDAAGNLYIADNQAFRKLSTSGAATTLAACPNCGGFVHPVLAADAAGNVYAANGSRAWKITPDGAVTDLAGSPTMMGGYSGEGGPATQAVLGRIEGIAVSAKGEPYLADVLNSLILRIAADGAIHTVTNGVSGPGGIVFDTAGNLYAAEQGIWSETSLTSGSNILYLASGSVRRLRKIAADGTITTVAGTGAEEYSGDGELASKAQLNAPWGVAADARGNVFVTDSGNHTLRRISPTGVISTLAGTGSAGDTGDGGPAPAAQLNQPLGVAADGSGNLFIAECAGNRVRKISAAGIITTLAPQVGLNCPHGVAVDASGNVYVADSGNHVIRRVAADGAVSTVAGTGISGFAGDGGPAAKAQLYAPTGLAFDAAGNLYIADTANNRIRRISANGTIDTVAGGGQYSAQPANDGVPATSVFLGSPQGVAVDAAGNLYIADTQSNHVRRVSAAGIISTIAGRALYGALGLYDGNLDIYLRGYTGDGGPSVVGKIAQPYSMAVGPDFRVYVTDLPNAALRVLTPSPIANAASGLYGPIAAGEIVTLYGQGLGPGTLNTGDSGTQVMFNGMAAQVLYSSATQVAAIVPPISGSTAMVEVRHSGSTALSFTVPIAAATPALFTFDTTGRGLALAIDADGSYNGFTHSAIPGDTITLFATGLGSGASASTLTATIGGAAASVISIGPASGLPGVTRIDVKVPPDALAATTFLLGGDPHVPVLVVLEVGGIASQPATYVTVAYMGAIA